MTNTLANPHPAPVALGKVSERKGARQHLDVAGRAHCGAGRGTIAAATRWAVDATVDTTTVCRRCLKALRAALAANLTAETAAGAAHMLAPADVATRRDADLLADMRAFHARLAADAEPAPVAWNHRDLILAELRAGTTYADLAA